MLNLFAGNTYKKTTRAYDVNDLNRMGIKVGDIVEVKTFEYSEKTFDDTRKIKGEVVEVGRRWFRMFVKCKQSGYHRCILFCNDNYRIVRGKNEKI